MNMTPTHSGKTLTTTVGATMMNKLRQLSTLDKITALALIVMSPLLVFGMMIVGGTIDRVALACGATALLAAALVVATGRRWAPLLAALPGGLMLAVAGRFIFQSLLAPRETINFGFWLFLIAIMGVATVASVVGTAQHYLRPEIHGSPRWIVAVLAAIGAATIGGIMVAALPQPPLGLQVDAAALGRLPAIGVKNFKYSQNEIHIKAGDSFALRLDNNDEGPHSFDIDELNVHASMASHSATL